MRMDAITRALVRRTHYSIEEAGAKIGLGRTQSYQAAKRKQIPTVRIRGVRMVERKPWDRQAKRILESKPAPADEINTST